MTALRPRGTVRALVVADDPLARSGLATLIEAAGAEAAAAVWPPDDVLDAVAALRPDVVCLDAGSELDPIGDEVWSIVDAGAPVLAFADGSVRADAWRAGAAGVLGRDADATVVAAALGALVSGLRVFERDAGISLEPGTGTPAAGPDEPLTPREMDVLALMAEGLPNKTIARRLGVSENTVKFHAASILGKLRAGSRTEAAIRAARLGIIPL